MSVESKDQLLENDGMVDQIQYEPKLNKNQSIGGGVKVKRLNLNNITKQKMHQDLVIEESEE